MEVVAIWNAPADAPDYVQFLWVDSLSVDSSTLICAAQKSQKSIGHATSVCFQYQCWPCWPCIIFQLTPSNVCPQLCLYNATCSPCVIPVCIATFHSVSVVAEFNKYWVKMPGPVISQHGLPPLTTQSHTTPPVPTTTPSILPGPVSISLIFPLCSTHSYSWSL